MSNSPSWSLRTKLIFAWDTKGNIFNLARPARGSWFKVPRMTVIDYHLISLWSRCYYYPHPMTKGLGFSDKEVPRRGIEPWAIWLKTPHAFHRRACLFKCQQGRIPRGQDERSQPLTGEGWELWPSPTNAFPNSFPLDSLSLSPSLSEN